jgi:hypothetical protein
MKGYSNSLPICGPLPLGDYLYFKISYPYFGAKLPCATRFCSPTPVTLERAAPKSALTSTTPADLPHCLALLRLDGIKLERLRREAIAPVKYSTAGPQPPPPASLATTRPPPTSSRAPRANRCLSRAPVCGHRRREILYHRRPSSTLPRSSVSIAPLGLVLRVDSLRRPLLDRHQLVAMSVRSAGFGPGKEFGENGKKKERGKRFPLTCRSYLQILPDAIFG